MVTPGRTKDTEGYRYGFQGHEDDKEIKGKGNHYAFGDYGLDSRIAKRFQPDPVVKRHESPYATFANNPIWFRDPTGLDTLKIGMNDNGHYKIISKIISDGNDVFQFMNGGKQVHSYTFQEKKEGKKGDIRLSALNLEKCDNYALGVFNINGKEGEGSYGFYAVPTGDASNEVGSNARLKDDDYNLIGSPDGYTNPENCYINTKWRMPWVTSPDDKKVICLSASFPSFILAVGNS